MGFMPGGPRMGKQNLVYPAVLTSRCSNSMLMLIARIQFVEDLTANRGDL